MKWWKVYIRWLHSYFFAFAHHDEQHERQRQRQDYSPWQENSSETWKWKRRTDLITQLQYYGLMFSCLKEESINSHVLTTGSRCLLYHGTPSGLHRCQDVCQLQRQFSECALPTTSISVNRRILNQKLDLTTKLMMDEQTIKTGSLWITMWKSCAKF